jgi:hypothetical protein
LGLDHASKLPLGTDCALEIAAANIKAIARIVCFFISNEFYVFEKIENRNQSAIKAQQADTLKKCRLKKSMQ